MVSPRATSSFVRALKAPSATAVSRNFAKAAIGPPISFPSLHDSC